MRLGFTLLELLIVIAIISILAIAGFGSFLNSIKSGKDAHRKTDLNSIQKALELYYQDSQAYPIPVGTSLPSTDGSLCHPTDCDTATYLKTLPGDVNGTAYYYNSDGTSYQLYSCLENANDTGPGVNQAGYVGTSCGNAGTRCEICRYGISSPNTIP